VKSLTVIVISGTIASGKSAVARALAREAERRGAAAAVIDLDLVYEMLEHDGARKDDESKWARARHAAGALANRFAADGVAIVIVEGEFLTAGDRRLLVEALDESVEPRFVTLRVSFDEAARRVDGDPARTFSRDLGFLRQHYDQAQAAAGDTPASDLLFDTEGAAVDDVATAIADWAIGD
jgi:tRNA uridine 5-carbamoylmethylation protein Kti12